MAKAATPKIGLRATAGHRTLTFGLVRVGVSMAPVLDASVRVKGNYICTEHGVKVTQKYECPAGHDVEGRPERAFPYGDGFVTLADGEVPQATSDDTIELVANVEVEAIPSEWIDKTYLAWPSDVTHDDAYMLVASYLRDKKRALIGTTVDHGTTKGLVISWSTTYGALVAQTMFYHDNVRWANVDTVRNALLNISDPDPAMAGMAEQLLDSIPDDFAWDEVQDDYGLALEAAVNEKGMTGGVTAAPDTADDKKVANSLLEALTASVAAKA